ncbi:MAG: formylglycine-generating enzyme family protein [bacterium]|nr:formylglycine-generating enzyme family protein [bacterium]
MRKIYGAFIASVLLSLSMSCQEGPREEKPDETATHPADTAVSSSGSATNSMGMELVLIPAGVFTMGSPDDVGEKNEHPQHEVTISQPFYMGKYPVTVGEFRQFAEAAGYLTEGERGEGSWVMVDKEWQRKADASWKNPGFPQTDEDPVVCVSWNDAGAFVAWLSEKEAKTYRLPTEAEFEYALRAGTDTAFFFGEDPEEYSKYGWIQTDSNPSGYPTQPVGMKLPNPWGLYDMIGNAWQWTGDWFDEGYYASSPAADPPGPPEGDYRVDRGGMGDAEGARSALRDMLPPSSDYSNQTFRIVLTIPDE